MKYPVPYDLRMLLLEADAAILFADKLQKLPFTLKKCLKLHTKARINKDKFWGGICKLYPELYGKIIYIERQLGKDWFVYIEGENNE